MAALVDALVGLSTALIGYLIGRLWQSAADRLPYRRARRFWRPVVRSKVQVVVGRFNHKGFPEPTGLVGGGDCIALRELSEEFAAIGLKRVDVVYVDESSLDRQANLILLGGPDTNEVTRQALELLQPSLRIVDPGPGIPMEVHDVIALFDAEASSAEPPPPGPRVFKAGPTTDYGVIIRARNPFNPEKALVLIAGAYGYGTWAGIELTGNDEFLRACQAIEAEHRQPARDSSALSRWGSLPGLLKRLPLTRTSQRDWPQLECLLKVAVYDRRPQTSEMVRVGPLLQGQGNSRPIRSSERNELSGSS